MNDLKNKVLEIEKIIIRKYDIEDENQKRTLRVTLLNWVTFNRIDISKSSEELSESFLSYITSCK